MNEEAKSQKTIAVIFGGCSSEYSVSLQSAYAVISHMDREKYTPVMIGISKEGNWFLFNGDIEKMTEDTWCNAFDCVPVTVSLDRAERKLLILGDKTEEVKIDAAFPILHGKNGEDGTVQGLFELAGIPVIGCGILASALCMDKDRSHQLVQAAGIRVPKSFVLSKKADMNEVIKQAEQIGFPLFVKPVKAGSSYGITKIKEFCELKAAIDLALQYDDTVIVEEGITGFEVGCAVIGNEKLTVGEIDEIELADGFFDFTEKYTLKTSAIHVPARVDKTTAEQVKQTAKKIYKALNCQVFARVDMFISDTGEIVFNEVNTIPGFTSHSRFPMMMKAIGLDFEKVISAVIELALAE